MSDVVTDAERRCERAEIEAWASVWEAALPDVRETFGLSLERAGGAVAFRATRFPWWFFNRILGLGLDVPADRAWLESQFDQYSDAGTQFGVSPSPSAKPADIPEWLEERGLGKGPFYAKMLLAADRAPDGEDGHDIREVGRDDARLLAETVVKGFGMPASLAGLFEPLPGCEGWHFYLAVEDGEPAGTGALFVSGDTAWLGFGSVLESHRGRGLHGALMAHRMRAGGDLGCQWLATETGRPSGDELAPSYHNMLRLGFEEAYSRPNYVFAPKPKE